MDIVPNPLPSWLTIKYTNTFPAWKLVAVKYIDETNPDNNQSVNIYLKTLDKNGNYQAGVRVFQAFPDGTPSELTKPEGALRYGVKNEPFGVAFPMSRDSIFYPDKGEAGPYWCYVQGNSDAVYGMGLPVARHNQFVLVWQWNEQPAPPTPAGHWQSESITVVQPDAAHIVITQTLSIK